MREVLVPTWHEAPSTCAVTKLSKILQGCTPHQLNLTPAKPHLTVVKPHTVLSGTLGDRTKIGPWSPSPCPWQSDSDSLPSFVLLPRRPRARHPRWECRRSFIVRIHTAVRPLRHLQLGRHLAEACATINSSGGLLCLKRHGRYFPTSPRT